MSWPRSSRPGAHYIQAETLTTRLVDAPPQDGAYVEEHQVDGETLTISVKRA